MHKPPVKLDEGKVRIALGDEDTAALVLLTIALNAFGDELFGDPEKSLPGMDPAEIWAGLHEMYGTWVTESGENRLNAIMLGLEDGGFWRDRQVFVAVATALFDGDLGDLINGGFEDLTTTEIVWAMLEMELAHDDPDGAPDMSLHVQDYVTEALRKESEEQDNMLVEIAHTFKSMMEQLRGLGIPPSMLRVWDSEYETVMEDLDSHY
jgi:hypothetical protein